MIDELGPGSVPAWWQRCLCGHPWITHDVNEYRGDGTELCCEPTCNQTGCPGRQTAQPMEVKP